MPCSAKHIKCLKSRKNLMQKMTKQIFIRKHTLPRVKIHQTSYSKVQDANDMRTRMKGK